MEQLVIAISLDELGNDLPVMEIRNKQEVRFEIDTGKKTDVFVFKWDDLLEDYYVNINGRLAVGAGLDYFVAILMAYYA